jgi:hypothetical protein
MKYLELKKLIGQHVNAIGNCGMAKGKKVFGILSEDNGMWVVNVILEDGDELPCSVYSHTITEA